MEDGYLIVETHGEHPDLVRIRSAEAVPQESAAPRGPRVRYAARFNDVAAAQMQVHSRLRRRLVDIQTGFYRTDVLNAVAAAESLALRHHQVYLDPNLAAQPHLAEAIAKLRWRQRLTGRLWQGVGVAAVLFLLLKLLLGF